MCLPRWAIHEKKLIKSGKNSNVRFWRCSSYRGTRHYQLGVHSFYDFIDKLAKPFILCILTAALKSWERNSGDPPRVKTKTATDFLSEICKPGGPVEEALNYLKAIGILPTTTVSLYYPLVSKPGQNIMLAKFAYILFPQIKYDCFDISKSFHGCKKPSRGTLDIWSVQGGWQIRPQLNDLLCKLARC